MFVYSTDLEGVIMAGGREYSAYQSGIINRYYGNLDTIVLGKLGELVSDLAVCENPGKAMTLWKNVQSALKKTPADPVKVGRIVAERNVKALAELVGELTNMKPGDVPKAAGSGGAGAGGETVGGGGGAEKTSNIVGARSEALMSTSTRSDPTNPDTLKSAMTAFKKRLKYTRLDAESKISNRALTSGKKNEIDAIIPPREFPRAVWDELAKQGKLKDTGGGFFQLLTP